MQQSWLVEHLESYVFPLALKAMADGKTVHHLSPSWKSGKPVRGLRPARSSAFDFDEEGLIFSFLKSYGLIIQRDVRDKKYDAAWYPRLKSMQVDVDWFVEQREAMLRQFKNIGEKHDEQFWPIVKNAWRSVKAASKGRPIILPGRDVWIWEVMARHENYPTLYSPTLSRMVIGTSNLKSHLDDLGIGCLPDGCYIFDTGFAGTIPQAIQKAYPERHFSYVMLSKEGGGELQVFRNRKGSRERALIIEGFPKYEESARAEVRYGAQYQGPRMPKSMATTDSGCTCSYCNPFKYMNGSDSWPHEETGIKITQPHSNLAEIVQAALLTIRVWHGVWPRFVRNPKVPKPKSLAKELKQNQVTGLETTFTYVEWPKSSQKKSGILSALTEKDILAVAKKAKEEKQKLISETMMKYQTHIDKLVMSGPAPQVTGGFISNEAAKMFVPFENKIKYEPSKDQISYLVDSPNIPVKG